jgi:hypothetical protein
LHLTFFGHSGFRFKERDTHAVKEKEDTERLEAVASRKANNCCHSSYIYNLNNFIDNYLKQIKNLIRVIEWRNL